MLDNEQLKALLKDVGIIFGIVIVFLILCYLVFGMWTPMYVVYSSSMEPSLDVGDIVFIRTIDRADVITQDETLHASKARNKFGAPGDVILYRPYGNDSYVPVVHRVIYYVEEGQEMWPGGPTAPHAGYVTRGDNQETNPEFDQNSTIMPGTPVKEEWIIGIAQFKFPYIGKLRLIFSPKHIPF